MLPFQNTTIYRNTITLTGDLLRFFEEKKTSAVFLNNIQQEALNLVKNLAKALAKDENEERQEFMKLTRESIYGLISLVEVAQKELGDGQEMKIILQRLIQLQQEFNNFQKKKRILILTSAYGQGHMSAAKAIKQGIEKKYGHDFLIEVIDFGKILNASFDKVTAKVYEGSTKFTPSIYKLFFDGTDAKWQIKLLNMLNYPFSASKLTKFFKDHDPDLIVSTFPTWDWIAVHIWKKHNPGAKFLSIVTDSISIHNVWVAANTDYHIVPNLDTALVLKKLGVEESKIKTLGFPVQLGFTEEINREAFLKKLNLDPKKFTILFLPTAQRQRTNRKIMKELLDSQPNANIVVITGRDEAAKLAFEKFAEEKNVKIIGWTDEMANFIKVADIVMTKAGGATVMECLAAEKPLIITSVIEGQEEGNAELIKKYQLGVVPESANMTIPESIDFVKKHMPAFKKSLKKISNPEASVKIASFINELITE